MLRLLRFLITGDWHLHKWEDVHKGRISNSFDEVQGFFFIQRCQHCGKVKNTDL